MSLSLRRFPLLGGLALLAVAATAALTAPDARAQGGSGSITGKVTDSASPSQPIAGICVNAWGETAGSHYAEAGADGGYSIEDLAPDTYTVSFSDCNDVGDWVSEYYDNKTSAATADPVVVDGGPVALEDVRLEHASHISGKVTPEGSTTGLEGVCVTANTLDREVRHYGNTDAGGNYEIELPPGTYKVEFDPRCGPDEYLGEWYSDQPSFNTADDVVVASEEDVDVSAGLELGGKIAGTVTGAGSGAIEDVCVTAYGLDGSNVADDRTDQAGDYEIDGLEAGSYKLGFDATCADPGHLSEWWNDKPSLESADSIDVALGETDDADAELALGGSIAGRVTNEAGTGIQGVCVSVYDASFGYAGNDETDASGFYFARGLKTGDHYVLFSAGAGCGGNYFSEYWNDTTDPSEADAVAVTAPETSPGVDATLASMPVGASISGTVTNGTDGLPDICVSAEETNGAGYGSAQTNTSGSYTITGLPAGSYRIRFSPCNGGNYLGEYYDDEQDPGAADLVTVATSQARTGIDAVLASGARITGTVNGPSGPLAGICVDVMTVDGQGVKSDSTGPDGAYVIEGLRSGSYKIGYVRCAASNVMNEYWDDEPDVESADVVAVTAGSDYGPFDPTLAAGAEIRGTVTGPGGEGLASACVSAYDAADPTQRLGNASTTETGDYAIQGLPAGSYKVEFDGSCAGDNYLSEWWDDKQRFDDANPVTVASEGIQEDVDAVLAEGGRVSGTVTDENTGLPLSNVCVTALNPADESDAVGFGSSEEDGTYVISGLPAGDVKLLFEDCGSSWYWSEYFDDRATFAAAEMVPVTPGATTGGRDAELARGGRITGHLSGAGDNKLGGMCVTAYRASDGEEMTSDVTDDTGDYFLGPLPSGEYKVGFEDCDDGLFASEFWDDKPNLASAETITVTAPAWTEDINADLGLDTVPPAVSITDGPEGTTTNRLPTFSFSIELGAEVACSIDSGTADFGPCSGANSHAPGVDLVDGNYVFRIRATDPAGNEATATRSFTVVDDGGGDDGGVGPAPEDPVDEAACEEAENLLAKQKGKLKKANDALKAAKKTGKAGRIAKAKSKVKAVKAKVKDAEQAVKEEC